VGRGGGTSGASRAASDDLYRSSRCNLYRVSFYRPGRSDAGRLSYCPGKSCRAHGSSLECSDLPCREGAGEEG